MVDPLFLLAVGAIAWGLSLATYRLIALRNGWPLGAVQAAAPAVPLAIGLVSLSVGLAFAHRAADTASSSMSSAGSRFLERILRVGAQRYARPSSVSRSRLAVRSPPRGKFPTAQRHARQNLAFKPRWT
jgi:hypothetical protein